MASAVQKSDMYDDIWNNFKDIIKNNVTSVTLSDSSTSTIVRYTNSYSDEIYESKSNFPMIIIYTPQLPEEELTYRDRSVNGNVTIEVIANKNQELTKFLGAIRAAIESNEATFNTNGINEIQVESDDMDTDTRGGFQTHWGRINYSFVYNYTRT